MCVDTKAFQEGNLYSTFHTQRQVYLYSIFHTQRQFRVLYINTSKMNNQRRRIHWLLLCYIIGNYSKALVYNQYNFTPQDYRHHTFHTDLTYFFRIIPAY